MSQQPNGNVKEALPVTEVVKKIKRRQYTAEYELHILREGDRCQGSGEISALLSREDCTRRISRSGAYKASERIGWIVSAETEAEGGPSRGRTGQAEARE